MIPSTMQARERLRTQILKETAVSCDREIDLLITSVQRNLKHSMNDQLFELQVSIEGIRYNLCAIHAMLNEDTGITTTTLIGVIDQLQRHLGKIIEDVERLQEVA